MGEYEDIADITSVSHPPPSLQASTTTDPASAAGLALPADRVNQSCCSLHTVVNKYVFPGNLKRQVHMIGSYIAVSAVCLATFATICQCYHILHVN